MKVKCAWVRDRATFGQLVDQSGLSERELARQAGLGHATVNHLLTGRRESCSAGTADAIARILGVRVEVVFIKS